MGKFKDMIKGDRLIWGVMVCLGVIGVVEVYSSTAALALAKQNGNTFYYAIKHFAFLLASFFTMFVFSLIPYKHYVKHANWLLGLGVLLLICTFFSSNTTNDAKRWLTIPIIGLTFQPSDFVKLVLMLYLSKMLALAQVEPEKRRQCFLYSLGAIFGVCLLVLPSNFSTAALIGAASFIVLILGQFPRKWRWGVVGAAIVAFAMFMLFAKVAGIHTRIDTWVSRIETFVSGGDEKGSDFQAEQARVCIGLGGLKGVGIGHGVQGNSVPYPYSDFIFASIAHEGGIIGVVLVLALYMMLFYRCVAIVKDAKTLFPALLVMGLVSNIMLQAFANIVVAIGLFPVTGQPLPFVSLGGSSMLCTSIALGVILNISRYSGTRETVEEIEKDVPEEEIVDYPFMAG